MTRLLRTPVVWLPITIGLFAIVIWRARPWDAADRLGSIDPWPLLLAIALNLVIVLLWAIRSSSLLRRAGSPVGVVPLVPMVALANTVNNVTPGSVGEVLRLYLLKARHGVGYSIGTAVVLIERIIAIGYLAGSGLIAWAVHLAGAPAWLAWAGFLALAALPAVPYLLGLRPTMVAARLPLGRPLGRDRWARAVASLARIDAIIGTLLVSPSGLVFALTSALVFATYTAQLLLVAAALAIPLDPMAAWGALGVAIAAGVISVLPFGLGATDLVLAALLVAMNVTPALAASIVFGYRLTTTVPLAIAGAASYAFLSATLPAGGARSAMREVSIGLEDAASLPAEEASTSLPADPASRRPAP